jgi:hypothetical protein
MAGAAMGFSQIAITLNPTSKSGVAVNSVAAQRATVILERFIGLLLRHYDMCEGFCSLLLESGCHLPHLLTESNSSIQLVECNNYF